MTAPGKSRKWTSTAGLKAGVTSRAKPGKACRDPDQEGCHGGLAIFHPGQPGAIRGTNTFQALPQRLQRTLQKPLLVPETAMVPARGLSLCQPARMRKLRGHVRLSVGCAVRTKRADGAHGAPYVCLEPSALSLPPTSPPPAPRWAQRVAPLARHRAAGAGRYGRSGHPTSLSSGRSSPAAGPGRTSP